jgi:hypothetical protein
MEIYSYFKQKLNETLAQIKTGGAACAPFAAPLPPFAAPLPPFAAPLPPQPPSSPFAFSFLVHTK